MTPQLLVVILICIFAVIFGQPLLALLVDYGIPLLKATRRRYLHVEWHGVMSRIADEDQALESNADHAISPATTIQQDSNNGIATPATDSNALLLQNTAANLATMVKAGKIGETEGIKMLFGVLPSSSNPRYIAARAALKEELAKLDPPKFRMTPEQENARNALGLNRAT
jgi:hypothetical protein